MKQFLALLCLLVVVGAGCVSKSKANAQARAAFMAGQRQGMAMAAKHPSVVVIGNVKTQLVPWSQDLTLTKAVVAAEYRGANDPSEIIVKRTAQADLHFRAQQLLEGQDMPLQAGDEVEIIP